MEIRRPVNSTDLYVRFNFKNGTSDANFNAYPMWGESDGNLDVPMNRFNLALEVMAFHALSYTLAYDPLLLAIRNS